MGRGRPCIVCAHPHREQIDRLIAGGTNDADVGRQYSIDRTAIRRHRITHAKLDTASARKALQTAGTIALATLPSREEFGGMYERLRREIEDLITQAKGKGSSAIVVAGLNALRGTLDSYSRLAGHVGGPAAAPTVNVNVDVSITAAVQQIIAAVAPTDTRTILQLEKIVDG